MTNKDRFENILFDTTRTIVEKRFKGLYQRGTVLVDENGKTVAAKIFDTVEETVTYDFK